MTTTKVYSPLKSKESRLGSFGFILALAIGFIILIVVIGVIKSIFSSSPSNFFDHPKSSIITGLITATVLVVAFFIWTLFDRSLLQLEIDPVFKKVIVSYKTSLSTRHTVEMDMDSFDYSIEKEEKEGQEVKITLSIMKNKKKLVTILSNENFWPLATMEQIFSDFNELKSPLPLSQPA